MPDIPQIYNDRTKDLLFAILTALGGNMQDIKGIFFDTRDDLLYAILERLSAGSGMVYNVADFIVNETNEERSIINYATIVGASGVLINIGSQFIDTTPTDNRHAIPDLVTGNIDLPPIYQGERIIILKY